MLLRSPSAPTKPEGHRPAAAQSAPNRPRALAEYRDCVMESRFDITEKISNQDSMNAAASPSGSVRKASASGRTFFQQCSHIRRNLAAIAGSELLTGDPLDLFVSRFAPIFANLTAAVGRFDMELDWIDDDDFDRAVAATRFLPFFELFWVG
jgi:hypothetical protein